MAKTSTINPISGTTAYTYAFNWLTINSDTTGSISKGDTVDISFSYNTNYGLQSRSKKITVNSTSEASENQNSYITVTQSAASSFANIESFTATKSGSTETVSGTEITMPNAGGSLAIVIKTNNIPAYFGTSATDKFMIYTYGDNTYAWIDSSASYYAATTYIPYDASNTYAYGESGTSIVPGTMSGNNGFGTIPAENYTAYTYAYMHINVTIPVNNSANEYNYELNVLGTKYKVTSSGVTDADITISGPTSNLSATAGTFDATIASNFDTDYTVTISD